MKIITRDQRLVQRAYWMVSHRWLAIFTLAAFTWLGKNIFDVDMRENILYLLAISLIIVNLLSLWLLEIVTNKKDIDQGGDLLTREIHHILMWFFILFAMVHIYLVFYHDYIERNGVTSSMIGGWKFQEEGKEEREMELDK